MSRLWSGRNRLLVKFHWPDGRPGFDFTAPPDLYDECAKLSFVLGIGTPWEVVDPETNQPRRVSVEGSLIVGPVVDAAPN